MDNVILPPGKTKSWFLGAKKIILPPDLIQKNKSNKLINNFYFTGIGYYPKAVDHGIERKAGCEQYIFIYCIEGSGVIQVCDEPFFIKQHMYFIIPKNKSHLYYSSTKNPWSIYWIHFSGKLDNQLFQRFMSDNQLQPRTVHYDHQKIEIFKQVFELLEEGYTERTMEMVNLNLLYIVSLFIYPEEAGTKNSDYNAARNSISFMGDNIDRMITINELANQQHISISHYSRVFKRYTGQSPIQYFMKLKIQTSCQSLCFTNKSIKEISSFLGFEDPFYFSRLFKTIMGVSPRQYRKAHREDYNGTAQLQLSKR